MQVNKSKTSFDFGSELVDDISLPPQHMNLLFSALLLTVLGVFIGANLLLLDPETVKNSAQILLFCISLVLIFYAFSKKTHSLIWGLVLTYGLVWLLVYTRLHVIASVVYLSAMMAIYVAIRNLRVERKNWMSALVMGVVATLAILALAMEYTSFDMLPRLHAGYVHQDTLFHASIAAMIKNYGISSTGLNGLVEIPYHTFSHALMAGISLVSGSGVIEVYGVANSVLFAPILVFCIAAFCAKLDRTHQFPLPLIWTVACLILVAMPFLFSRWAVWPSYFTSESYLVALGMLMLGLALLFKQRLTLADLIVVAILAAMIANTKASVGLLFTGLWFARLIFLRSPRTMWVLAAGLLTAFATGFVVLDAAQAASGSMQVDSLHFIRNYSYLGTHLASAGKVVAAETQPSLMKLILAFAALGGFFIIHFFLSWVIIWRVVYQNGSLGLINSPLVVYSLAAVFAGVVITLTFSIDGGSAYYFSNIAFFVSLPGVIVLVVSWIERRSWSPQRPFFIITLLLSLLGLEGFYLASAFSYYRADHVTKKLISQLLLMRTNSPIKIVWRANLQTLMSNPIKRCTAQPFLYPAVSERPWVGVISGGDKGWCNYYGYGYEQYGVTTLMKQVSVQPNLLPDLIIKVP